MTDILKLIPPMLTGAELHKALAVNPEYAPAIRHASAAERLMALNTLYDIYYPFNVSSTVYTIPVLLLMFLMHPWILREISLSVQFYIMQWLRRTI